MARNFAGGAGRRANTVLGAGLLLVLAGMVLFIFLALVVPMMQMGSQL